MTAQPLRDLMATALTYRMTPKEEYEQRVSFVWGMLPLRSRVTIDEVRCHLAEMGIHDPDA